MPRLFTGIFLPEDVQKAIAIPSDPAVRPVPAHFLHCTLMFLGSVPGPDVPHILDALKQVRFEPFEARLTAGGIFGSPPGRLVLWAGMEPAAPVAGLRTAISIALERALPDRPFSPHITLGRSVRGADPDKENWLHFLGRLPNLPFLVSSFDLVESETRPEGAHYTSLGRFGSTA